MVSCLTIGSSDSSGGAGIQGDVKAFASVGCHASVVIVGVTAQNTCGVRARFTVPLDVVEQQLDAVLADIRISAVKVGTTWSAELLELVARRLRPLCVPVVFDPVMVTTAGSALAGGQGAQRAIVEQMFPLATVITPNREEAKALAGEASDDVTNRELAERLVHLGARAVIVSSSAREPADWLADGRRSQPIGGARHAIDAEHGVGCAHSSLLAGLLARGSTLSDAAREARRRAAEAVRRGLVGVGRGRHPVDVLDLRRFGRALLAVHPTSTQPTHPE